MESFRRPDDGSSVSGNSILGKRSLYSLSDDDNVNAQSREIVQLPDNGRSLPEFDTKKPGRQSESSRQSFADNHFSHSSRKGLPEFASSFLESLDGGNRGNRSDAKRNGTLPLRLNTII